MKLSAISTKIRNCWRDNNAKKVVEKNQKRVPSAEVNAPSEITAEQAWNKIAEAYPESPQSLRNTLDNAVFGKTYEPQKVKVPKFVAAFIRENPDPIFEICAWAEHYGSDGRNCDDPELSAVLDWYGNDRQSFYEAVCEGYEVEEEPVWIIENEHGYRLSEIKGGAGNALNWAFDSTNKKYMTFANFEIAKKVAYLVTGNVYKLTEGNK